MGIRREEGYLILEQHCRKINLDKLCREQRQPFYLYDIDGITQRLNDFKESFSDLKNKLSIHYALKANTNAHVIRAFSHNGVGLDVVSGGEIQLGLKLGVRGEDMVFSGVGKTTHEIDLALKSNVKQINVESPQELKRIAQVAEKFEIRAPVALRLNPDVNPETHPYIRTGFHENKFGMDKSFLPEIQRILKEHHQSLDLRGLTLHVGSQIRDIKPIVEAIEKVRPIYFNFCEKGYNLKTMDIGGGIGINYDSSNPDSDLSQLRDYGKKVSKVFSDWPCEVLCEPGRILVGRFGVLFGEVQYIKRTPYKNFAILNTGMHHLIRPCLYQARHRIEKVYIKPTKPTNELYDIVGPICESSDVIGFERHLPKLSQGDYLMICDAGAYGFVMANNYNSHDLPMEIVYSEGETL